MDAEMTEIFLGTHRPRWLELAGPPLMVSRRTMPKRRLPRAVVPWILDSGGFSEIALYGEWTISAGEYVAVEWYERAMSWPRPVQGGLL